MPLFRKKPVVIEAVLFDGQQFGAYSNFVPPEMCEFSKHPNKNEPALLISTLEGMMRADLGDWIIKGVKGEFYPCKPEIFAATYESADAKPSPDSATPQQPKSGRKEVYAFMKLPYHVRMERAKRIGVFEEADCGLDDTQQMLAWVKRAKAAGIVSDLMPTEAATTGKGEQG